MYTPGPLLSFKKKKKKKKKKRGAQTCTMRAGATVKALIYQKNYIICEY